MAKPNRKRLGGGVIKNKFSKEKIMENSKLDSFVVYGKQPVYEALRSKHIVRKVIIAREIEKKGIEKILRLVKNKNIELAYEKKSNFQKLCGPVLHQGIVALLKEYTCLSENDLLKKVSSNSNSFIIILDQIQDPHNLGAIIRTAEIAQVTAVILPEKGSATINPTVAKTSAGAIFHCPICRTNDLPTMIGNLQKSNHTIIAMVPHRSETIYDTDLVGKLAVIIGSEGKGVRKNIQVLCDKKISIPGWGKIDSLNASVSAAIVLFEAVRQRQYRSD
jgi:23S rRNA (guanosine2251-2'-O)-methyltransferase